LYLDSDYFSVSVLDPQSSDLPPSLPENQRRAFGTQDSVSNQGPSHRGLTSYIEIKAESIGFIVWQANSSDLYPIEEVQKHHKALLEDLCFEVKPVAKHVEDHCKEGTRCVRQEYPVFKELALQAMNPGNFLRFAKLCRKHKDNNSFKA
jgi:hypothetical protein